MVRRRRRERLPRRLLRITGWVLVGDILWRLTDHLL